MRMPSALIVNGIENVYPSLMIWELFALSFSPFEINIIFDSKHKESTRNDNIHQQTMFVFLSAVFGAHRLFNSVSAME